MADDVREEEQDEAGAEAAGGEEAAGEPEPGQMTEEELRAILEKQFREQKVSDMLVQFMASLSHMAYIKMGLTDDTRDVRDLAQASLAIDSFKALLDAAGDRVGGQDASALAGALASMQMTFAKAGSAGEGGEPEKEDEGGSATDRLWVPGKE